MNGPFNPVIHEKFEKKIKDLKVKNVDVFARVGAPREVSKMFESVYMSGSGNDDTRLRNAWALVHASGWFRNKEGRWVKRKSHETRPKEFTQRGKDTPPDPYDGHTHMAAFDEDGNGGTDEAGSVPHTHSVFNFKIQPFYHYDPTKNQEYVSVHPGSIAFKEEAVNKFGEIGTVEMEIFRVGNHHGDENFTEKDLIEIADNFRELAGELRPKLKITHRGDDGDEEKKVQENLAGLASYGDVTDVFTKKGKDGLFHLYATVENVPKEVIDWIRERRFPERSIEIYPEFRAGTDSTGKVYKNVLKAIALLGAEMPAVLGMAPIKLEECIECQGTECIVQSFVEKEVSRNSLESKDSLEAIDILSESMKIFQGQVESKINP